MAFDCINEAFQRLSALEEEMFNASADGINELSMFLDNDDTEVVRVIDPEATDETELSDTYIGKVIVNCNICHSHIFEDKENIHIDEDGVVNGEEACPYCGQTEGFMIVGEIAPFSAAEEAETEEEPANESSDKETSEETTVDAEESTEEEPLEEALGVGAGLALGGAALGAGLIGSKLLDDVQDTDEDELLNEETPVTETMSRASQRCMNEDFKEVTITTDDQHMEMTSDDNGKVTVTTEPIVTEEVTESEETIVPVSDETADDLISNTTEESPVVEEAPVVEETPEEPSVTEEDVVEVSFDETDDESFDELGENYFKRVYENVESFKTTNVMSNNSHLIVEGIIKFTSGNENRTGFVFEAKDVNTKGQLRFIGTNKQLTESKDAFALVGHIDNNKLFVESLKYNYTVSDQPIRGIVRRK